MNDNKYLEKMKELIDDTDTESAHQKTDALLCALLHKLGYKELVREYRKMYKWYA